MKQDIKEKNYILKQRLKLSSSVFFLNWCIVFCSMWQVLSAPFKFTFTPDFSKVFKFFEPHYNIQISFKVCFLDKKNNK